MSVTQLSIIIPAFNEEKRIGDTLNKIYGYMANSKFSHEILVVDDGSSDGTIDEAGKSRSYLAGTLRVLSNGSNRGKGYSVRHGIRKSVGDYILFTDADLSTPISEIDKLFSVLNEGSDIAIGSRSVGDSSVEVSQTWYRQGMGKVFNYLMRMLLHLPFRDTQCGFKLMKGNIARGLADKMLIDDFCFDVELLYLAVEKGYKIKETGVVWKNSPMSKVKVFSSSLGMFRDLFRIKFSKR